MLQGFPDDFRFADANLSNLYRHIGDAVPPLISFQIAHLCGWMLKGERPRIEQIILPGTHLSAADVREPEQRSLLAAEDCVAETKASQADVHPSYRMPSTLKRAGQSRRSAYAEGAISGVRD